MKKRYIVILFLLVTSLATVNSVENHMKEEQEKDKMRIVIQEEVKKELEKQKK